MLIVLGGTVPAVVFSPATSTHALVTPNGTSASGGVWSDAGGYPACQSAEFPRRRVGEGEKAMVEVTMRVSTSPEQVFSVLADGWFYAGWVVGASHIREVDTGWPAEGTQIHHSVGPWPLLVHDVTGVRAVAPPRMLELDARLWPFGAARIRLELTEIDPGVTEIRMLERAFRGPGRLLPEAVQTVLLAPRNRESLRRLARMAIGKRTVAG